MGPSDSHKRFPSRSGSGFVHLSGGPDKMYGDDAIRLTQVKSNATARTSGFDSSGAEKAKDHPHHHHHHHHHLPQAFHRGRRQKAAPTTIQAGGLDGADGGRQSDTAHLNLMGRIYKKVINFSIVSRYLVYILPIGLILAAPVIVLAVTGHMNDLPVGNKGSGDDLVLGPPLFQLLLWIEITWLTVWAAKLAAWFLPKAFMFFCGIVSAGTRKYATVLSNMSVPFTLFFWALASWITFIRLFAAANSRDVRWVKIISTILAALFVSSAVFLAEKAIVQLIGVSYHQRSFANRIRDSKREIFLLGLLYDASRTLFPMYCPDFSDEDYIIDDSIELKLNGGKKRSGSPSANPAKIIGDVGRFGGKVTSVFGNIASEITGKDVFKPNSAHSIVIEALERHRSSEALARRIWMSFVVQDNDALYVDDVVEVLGPAYKAEAEEAFGVIDGDGNGDISLDEMIRKVSEMGRERKAIAEGMKDIGQALGAFDQVLLFAVFLIVIFIFLAFFQSSFVTVIASAGTALLSLSFIFAVTAQEFLGSCIFLFIKHPFDVGDRVEINGTQLVVERISLLYSVFTRADTEQISQVPNIQLNNLWVDNFSRSKAMCESFEIDVSFDTSFEDIELLRREMEIFVRDSDNSRDFQPDFNIGVGGVGNMDKLTLQISVLHKSNWHNAMVRASRRSKFMCALAVALKKIPINGPGGGGDVLGGPANPTYSVAVTDEWAEKSRNDSAKSKAEARLVPPPADEDEAKKQEEAAIEGIAHRPPVPTASVHRDDRSMLGDELERTATLRSPSADRVDLRRASTRGRRRAGESMISTDSVGGEMQSPQSSSFDPRPSGDRRGPFDEEAQTGLSPQPRHYPPGGNGAQRF